MQAGWLAEFRRRNVHRVLIAYLAVAWLLAQVAEFLSDAFAWPAWILRALVVVLLLGLPAAVAIAWFFEWTPAGLVREEPAPRGAALRLRPHRSFDLAIAALLAVALGYFAATHEWRDEEPRPPPAGRATLAVLPFKPVVATDRDEALEFGMADTLILRLSGIAGMAVSPLSSVRRYSALDSDALAAGRELGVRSVLDGSVQRSGERLRVTARLMSVDDGRQLWSGRFDEQYTDIFAVQDSIADRVTAALAVQLTSVEQQRLARRPTSDSIAYDLFLNGRYYWNRRSSPVNLQKSIDYYSQAVARDPQFALAYSGLADALAVQAVFAAREPREVYPAALQAAERALHLDPDLAEAHATRGHIRLNFQHDWPGALEDFDEAIRHDPRYAMARVWRGLWLVFVGRTDEGLAELATAVELEPSSMPPVVTYARGLYSARRYGEAAGALERVVEVEPQNMLARSLLASVYIELGRFDEALVLATDVAGKAPGGFSVAAVALARAGRTDEARAALDRLVELSQHRYVPAYDIALVHAALGDVDEAFQWLDRALAEPSALLGNLRVDRVLDPLRGDPRYREIERRLRLPEP
jgi:TolB-like protein/Flp pilus assembly protein TadD